MRINKIVALATFLISALGQNAIAKSVDVTTARTVGMNFLKMKGLPVNQPSDLELSYTATGTSNTGTVNAYYVFNVVGQQNFVMVSGDDIIRPILAYSDRSNYEYSKISPAAKDWIEGYKNQILASVQNNIPARTGTPEKWNDLVNGIQLQEAKTTAVAPLLHTTWDQANPYSFPPTVYYNDSCPGTGSAKAPTGCVATAMAQVMKFWNWPTVGTGYHSYVCTSYTPTPSVTLAANFGNTAYNWAGMPNNITGPNAAIAQLMYHAGVSVDMQYSTVESGTWVIEDETWSSPFTACAEYALKTYFHFKPTLRGIPRFGEYGGAVVVDSMTEAAWITMLKNELNAGRPMLYSGSGTGGGHCWVCDGWETSGNMFDFNWGWSGGGPDGYYTVDNLTPPALGTGGGSGGGFNQDQCVVIGIQPDSFPNIAGNMKLLAHLNYSINQPMEYGTPFSITTKVKNGNTATFHGDFCANVYDTLNTLVGTIQTLSSQTINAGDSLAMTFGPAPMYGMIPMEYYHVQVMYRNTGATTWTPVANNGTFINYNAAEVVDDTDIRLNANISVASSLPVMSGSTLKVVAQLYNNAMSNFSGSIQATMYNVFTGVAYPVQTHTGQSIGIYNMLTDTFTHAAFVAPNGLYALVIQHQYNGSGSFVATGTVRNQYENPILVHVGFNTGVASVTEEKDVFVFPNPSKDIVHILPNGITINNVTMMDMQGRMVSRNMQPFGKGFMVPVSDLAAGTYIFRIETENGTITKKVVVGQ
jgi:Peptidase C10 family/Spi protease inhibitor/Secretion system C-terminal sorting domain